MLVITAIHLDFSFKSALYGTSFENLSGRLSAKQNLQYLTSGSHFKFVKVLMPPELCSRDPYHLFWYFFLHH